MVVAFGVSNFLSFSDRQSITFRASPDLSFRDTHCVSTHCGAVPRLTRTGLIVGANGSGKSNFLLALKTMRDLVLYSNSFSPEKFAELYRPFGFSPSSIVPSEFRIELLLSGVRYDYGFAYDRQGIASESMFVYHTHKSQRWFERERDPVSGREMWQPFSSRLTGSKELWRKSTRPTALFLTTAAQLNAEQLLPVLRWFEHQLDFSLSSAPSDLRTLAKRLQEARFKATVIETLQAVDVPVVDVRVTTSVDAPVSSDANRRLSVAAPAAPSLQILYRRGCPAVSHWVDIQQEATGIQKLMSLLTPLVDGIEKDRLIAIDEFDTHLHPLIGRCLVRLVNTPAATPRQVQVLLISNTTALMDLNILRRDELWLMNRDHEYASRLTSFVDQKARKHEFIARAYLEGKYGALPRIDLDKFSGAPVASARLKPS
jgi:uncharacterized protein